MKTTRRQFLQKSAGTAGALAVSRNILIEPEHIPTAFESAVPASDRLRFGMIGVGMQGSALLANAVTLAGGECVAAADLYDGRHTLAKELAGAKIKTTRKYQELLDDKEIDCIIAAVPDHWHKQVVVDAVNAGKDIYCEKPMSHTPADGTAMVAAYKKTGRIVQIGPQRVSSVLCAKAKELLAQGIIGDLNLVEGTYGRNDPCGGWAYAAPTDASPETIDWDTWQGTVPKRSFDANIFARWRCWKAYGTGLAGDLLVHLVRAMGGILRWPDGRNMPDVHAALFQYGKYPVYLRLNGGCESPETYRFQGSKGALEVTEFGMTYYPQSGRDESPCYYSSGYPRAMREEYMKRWHAEHDPQVGKEPLVESYTYKGNDWDDVKPHLWAFFQGVRSRKPVVEDAVFGHNAALACHLANESYFRHAAVTWDAASGTIRS